MPPKAPAPKAPAAKAAPAPPPPAPPAATANAGADAKALPPVVVNQSSPTPPPPAPGPDVKTLVHQAPAPSVIQQAPAAPVSVQAAAPAASDDPIQQELTVTQLAKVQAPPPAPPTPKVAPENNPAIRTVVARQVPEGGSAGYIDAKDVGKVNDDGVVGGGEVTYADQQRILRKQREDALKSQ